jgi:hypothetical protein
LIEDAECPFSLIVSVTFGVSPLSPVIGTLTKEIIALIKTINNYALD